MPHRSPELTASSRILARAANAAARWPSVAVWGISLALLAGLLILDYTTRSAPSLLLPSVILASFVAWCRGERAGILISILIVASSTWEQRVLLGGPDVLSAPTMILNAVLRLAAIIFIAVVVNALRTEVDLERWRASVDALTGALNRRAFGVLVSERLRDARRAGTTLVLAYVDLDDFKQINDQFGHAAGDRVLVAFADGAAEDIRAGDLLARVGGDEFAILLTIERHKKGEEVAQSLHERLCTVLGNTGFAVSCSMGALIVEATDEDAADIYLQLADRLMYEVKGDGKSALRVERYDQLSRRLQPAGAHEHQAEALGLPRVCPDLPSEA